MQIKGIKWPKLLLTFLENDQLEDATSSASQLRGARESPGDVVKREILTQPIWGGTWDFAFLTSSQLVLMAQLCRHMFSNTVSDEGFTQAGR